MTINDNQCLVWLNPWVISSNIKVHASSQLGIVQKHLRGTWIQNQPKSAKISHKSTSIKSINKNKNKNKSTTPHTQHTPNDTPHPTHQTIFIILVSDHLCRDATRRHPPAKQNQPQSVNHLSIK
jgi:hypothetical protein